MRRRRRRWQCRYVDCLLLVAVTGRSHCGHHIYTPLTQQPPPHPISIHQHNTRQAGQIHRKACFDALNAALRRTAHRYTQAARLFSSSSPSTSSLHHPHPSKRMKPLAHAVAAGGAARAATKGKRVGAGRWPPVLEGEEGEEGNLLLAPVGHYFDGQGACFCGVCVLWEGLLHGHTHALFHLSIPLSYPCPPPNTTTKQAAPASPPRLKRSRTFCTSCSSRKTTWARGVGTLM